MTGVESVDEQVQRVGAEPAGKADPPNCRRDSERFTVDGLAEILVDGGASLFRGSITNISKTGCFISTSAPIRLPRGTPVEIVLTVNAKAMRISAELRFTSTKVGVGFRFLPMKTFTRAILNQVIEAIKALPVITS
jgi:hypothetical protein